MQRSIVFRKEIIGSAVVFLALLAVFLISSNLYAQESYQIKTKTGEVTVNTGDEITLETISGDELAGTVVSVSNQKLTLTSKFGEVKIEFENIKEIDIRKKADDKSAQQIWRYSDPLSQRTFFSPTGQTLKKGQKSYENYYLFFNNLYYGINDNITVNAGMSLFPSDNFIKNNVYLVGAKGKIFDTGNIRLSTGAEFISLPFKKADVSFLYPFAVLGFGNPDKSQVNISYGKLFYIGKHDKDDDVSSLLDISGQVRVSNNIKFIAEAMYPLEEKNVEEIPYVWGIRFLTKKIAVDLGFLNTTDSGIFPGIPMVSFCYTWR